MLKHIACIWHILGSSLEAAGWEPHHLFGFTNFKYRVLIVKLEALSAGWNKELSTPHSEEMTSSSPDLKRRLQRVARAPARKRGEGD